MEYRQHASVGVLRNDTYYKHVCAMTDEKLRDKSEIAEELAVRDMRIKELQAQLATMTQERDHFEKATAAHFNQLSASQAEITRLGGVCSDYRKTQEALLGDLAASQAREQQLREALEICKKEMQGDKWDALYIDGVLASK